MLKARIKLNNETVNVEVKGDTVRTSSGQSYPLSEVIFDLPCQPTKVIALWNNYKALADKNGLEYPSTPLYLFKPPNSWLACGQTIAHPPAYDGNVFFEGELGIVIGQVAYNLDAETATDAIAGYTCINDVTAFDLLKEYGGFDQWSRAKGFDTFGVIGPVVATDCDWQTMVITTRVNGEVVQEYPAEDMILPPNRIVSELSQNMTLYPGDVICCGTSIGLAAMPKNCDVAVSINGIGVLHNRYEDTAGGDK